VQSVIGPGKDHICQAYDYAYYLEYLHPNHAPECFMVL